MRGQASRTTAPEAAAGELPHDARLGEAAAHRSLLRAWYGGLLAGILPVLLAGFLYSALANRLAFAGWALVFAALYTVVLRQGLSAGWPPLALAGALALLLAAGAAAFAALESAHHEILDLGFRAVLPALYHPLLTRPATASALAAVLALAGVGAFTLALLHRPEPRA
jgi:hypothetical protein